MTECAGLFGADRCTDTVYFEDTLVGLQPEPSCGRGTTGIIWNCLVVMTFCTWSVIHLDTKSWTASPSVRKKFKRKFWTRVFDRDNGAHLRIPSPRELVARKVFAACILLLFPEYGLLAAIEELSVARSVHHSTQRLDGWETFSLKQAHLVRMGGVFLPQLERPEDFHLFVRQNVPFFEYRHFPSDQAIDLRAKRDIMDRVIATFQALYFICNVAIRNSRGYRISNLELLTLNYIAYSIVNFLIRLKKPQELYEAFEIDNLSLPSPNPINEDEPSANHRPRLEKWTWLAMAFAITAINLVPLAILQRGKSFSLDNENSDPEKVIVIIAIVGFGATLVFMLWKHLRSRQWKRNTIFKKAMYYSGVVLVFLVALLYLTLRSYYLVVVFQSFQYQASGVYATAPSWTQYLGHVGS
ncbi:hypothetical protein CC86DRAFT_63725 [Ophiobolus disseminans]|uniref:Uncharacterized protein n=1 Tax=Ophiobolus disseminans TaxID=1469910 RepID=A0A6A6ZSL7_9PLEO|nr:hypothetical protein CC86DRAFT_63725 [Ophiobolus disseminans]